MNAITHIAPAGPAMKPRLSPQAWVLAGFRALVAAGPDGIRVEALARDLGVTKGSFYWHYKDLRALHAAMLEAFENLAKSGLSAALRPSGRDPGAQLHHLVGMVSDLPEEEAGGAALEPALRDWARTDALARRAMQRVDAQRLADLARFFAASGLDEDHAVEGALRFYAALLGLEALRITCGASMRAPLTAVADAILSKGAPPG